MFYLITYYETTKCCEFRSWRGGQCRSPRLLGEASIKEEHGNTGNSKIWSIEVSDKLLKSVMIHIILLQLHLKVEKAKFYIFLETKSETDKIIKWRENIKLNEREKKRKRLFLCVKWKIKPWLYYQNFFAVFHRVSCV